MGVFVGDKLVATDPNGSRPWPVDVLANLLPRPNVDGTENYQKQALAEWKKLGGDAEAMKKMAEKFKGTPTLDDFNMLTRRIEAAEKIVGVVLLVDALANLADLVL